MRGKAAGDWPALFHAAVRARTQAFVALSSPTAFQYSARFAEFTLRNRIPAISPFRPFAMAGGLMSYGLNASLEAAGRMGVQTSYIQILPGETQDAAFDRIRRERVQGIIVFQDAGMVARGAQIAEFALRERLLAVSGWASFAQAGFIATYGPNLNDAYWRLAAYVNRLLKGARADSLPVELATCFELVLNMKTAKALGIAIPQSVLLRADEVIQ